MKNVLTGFLTSQDHFGIAPNYMIKGKRKFHTLICQIISLLMNLGCIAMFITLTIELIKRNNPTVNNVTLQLDKGPNATLNSKDLIIAIGILDSSYQVFNDPTVFTFEANYEVTTIYNDEMTISNGTRSLTYKKENKTISDNYLKFATVGTYRNSESSTDTDINTFKTKTLESSRTFSSLTTTAISEFTDKSNKYLIIRQYKIKSILGK